MIDVDLLFNLLIIVVLIGLVFWGGAALYFKLSESLKNLSKAVKKVETLGSYFNVNNNEGDYKEKLVLKSASPLAFDDSAVYCSTLEDKEKVIKRVETNLHFIEHLWQPQELLQLLSLVKSYITTNGEIENVMDYYLIRYLESLVMHLNLLNGYYVDSEGNLNEQDSSLRNSVYDEINHLYFYAKSLAVNDEDSEIENDSDNLPDLNIQSDDEQMLNKGIKSPNKDSYEYIEVDKVPKSKDEVSIDANDRLLHDLQNAFNEKLSS